MTRPWLIDELAHAGAEHLDPRYVAGYDRKAGYDREDGGDLEDDVSAFVAHGLAEASTVVDVGAGTGRFALAAAARFHRVVAVDVSPAMLRTVRQCGVDAGLSNLECAQAGFITYQHTGSPADGVYTRNALHQLPDFWKAMALERIATVLRPGGILRVRDLIYDFQPADADDVFERWFQGAADDPADGYTREDFVEHIRTEHSTFRWLFEPLLAAAGFEIVSADFAGHVYGAYTCVKR